MTMVYLRRRFACRLAVRLLAGLLLPAAAHAQSFPFGSELMLDQAPMRGSKRVPMLEIEENGAASIDLWCASAQAEATVGGDSISIVPGQVASTPQSAQCAPERQESDASLLAALAQVTAWRRNGDVIELFGPTPLRFRLMTN
jgi:heat shock protein HslJ